MNKIENRLKEQYTEGMKDYLGYDNIGCFLQGSQNYNLDTDQSDIDSRLIVAPSLYNLAMNIKPISTTYIMSNNEHVDIKDIRLFIQNLKKQNMNSLEILFTKYKIINEEYEDLWNALIQKREEIAFLNPYVAVRSMQGVAHSKMKYLKKPTEGKKELIEEIGYDPKQLHHLLRIEEYLERYMKGEESYEECLISKKSDYLKYIKTNILPIETVDQIAEQTFMHINSMSESAEKKYSKMPDFTILDFLNDIQYSFIKRGIGKELCSRGGI